VADFRALAHTFGVLAEAGRATPREVMTLMRDLDPKPTMRICGRLQIHDLAESVRAIPSVLPPATLTSDPHAPDLAPVLVPPTDGSSRYLMVGEIDGVNGHRPKGVIAPGIDGESGPEMARDA